MGKIHHNAQAQRKTERPSRVTLKQLLLNKGEITVPVFWAAVMSDLVSSMPDYARSIPAEFLKEDFILKELPALYREINTCLVSGDPQMLTELMLRPLPHCLILWMGTVRKCLERSKKEGLENFQALPEEANAIWKLRQSCGLYSRLTYEPEDYSDLEAKATDEFRTRVQAAPPCRHSSHIGFVGATLLRGLSFDCLTTSDETRDAPFAHGPGVVAEKTCAPYAKEDYAMSFDDGTIHRTGVDSSYFQRSPFQQEVLGLRLVMHGNQCRGYVTSRWSSLYDLKRSLKRCARLAKVPKDFRGPRLIAAEPAQNQYIMGAMDGLLREHLARHPLCRKIMNLQDQETSRMMVLLASRYNCFGTIDLKDASDHVRVWHLEQLLVTKPKILKMILGVRTGRVAISDEETISMTSLFTMGSKLTFPVESLVYASELIAAWLDERDLPWTEESVALAIDELCLWVYGDDIIVRIDYTEWAMKVLSERGFVPNTAKCCYRSPFRESCGCDAFGGYDVTPLRPRLLPGASEQSLTSYVDMIGQFAERGMVTAAVLLYKLLRYHGIDVPIVKGSDAFADAISSDVLYDLSDEARDVSEVSLEDTLTGANDKYAFGTPKAREYMRETRNSIRSKWCSSYCGLRWYWSWHEGPKLEDPPLWDLQRYRSNLIRGAGDEGGGYPTKRIRLRRVRNRGLLIQPRGLSPALCSDLLKEHGLDPSALIKRKERDSLTRHSPHVAGVSE